MLGLGRTVTLAAALAAGVGASQLPELGQQYRQRLGGAVDALGQVVAEFDADAERNGLDREAALYEMTVNPDPLVHDRAASMRRVITRYERLSAQAEAYAHAGPFGRLAAVAVNFDPELLAATVEDYEPGVPVTAEGAVSAGGGFVTVVLLGAGLGRLVRRRSSSRPERGTRA